MVPRMTCALPMKWSHYFDSLLRLRGVSGLVFKPPFFGLDRANGPRWAFCA